MIARTVHASSAPRGGATLSEVLVSLLVMSIGIVTLATLFPLSVLRSIQATQLTNATITRFNAEAMLGALPGLLASNPNAANPAIIDPLGYYNMTVAPATQAAFGIKPDGTPSALSRTSGNLGTVGAAAYVCTLGDSWSKMFDAIPTAVPNPGDTQITLPGSTPGLSDVTGTTVTFRAVLFDSTGRRSQVRNLTNPTGTSPLQWTAPIQADPTTATIGYGTTMRVESQEARYTWLLAVRPSTTGAGSTVNVDAIVIFRRAYDPQDEQLYDATFTQGSSAVTVTYPGTKPAFRKGGFVFDGVNAAWYRILNASDTGGQISLTVDKPAIANSNYAMFYRGVIDVFPIK